MADTRVLFFLSFLQHTSIEEHLKQMMRDGKIARSMMMMWGSDFIAFLSG
jgi:hypothetical protein